MSDITELFRRTATEVGVDPADATVDGDLSRGRVALRRDHRNRAIRRSMTAATTVAAAAVVAVIVAQAGGSSAGPHTHTARGAGHQHVATTHHATRSSIRLVAYNGKQLNGFTVDEIPAGWHLSTSTESALLITKDGSTDNDPDAFEGKLAVLTSSVDEHGLGQGDSVTVDGQPGKVDVQGDVQLLRYNDPSGFGVDIQAPTELGWTDAQIVKFAEGVHVTGNAVHTHG